MPKRFCAALCGTLLATVAATSVHAQCNPDPAASQCGITVPAILFVCPAGDGATLASVGAAIRVHVVDATGAVCAGLINRDFEVDGNPPSDIHDGAIPPGVQYDVPATGFLNLGAGDYLFDGPLIAGGVAAGGSIVKVGGVVIGGSPIPLRLTSVDLNADGLVNISDIGIFVGAMGAYDWRLDYNGDGLINVSDVSIFVSHLGHVLPAGFVVDPVD